MSDKELIFNVGLYYWEHKANYWDTLDEIEEGLAKLWNTTPLNAAKALHSRFEAGERSCFVKKNLPSDWRDVLKSIIGY